MLNFEKYFRDLSFVLYDSLAKEKDFLNGNWLQLLVLLLIISISIIMQLLLISIIVKEAEY